MAKSVSGGERERSAQTATFRLGPSTRVIADDGTEVRSGDQRIGKVAIEGRVPVGYYKDPEKSAQTFVRIDGRSYSMPGDYARVDADGTLVLLGRGSVCINTGGEKVFPEEVEEALKTHAAVADAVVVGVPDDRFGASICAVVETAPASTVDSTVLIEHVKGKLAGYKAPRHVLFVSGIDRASNGKVDYTRWADHARSQLVAG